MNQLLIFKDLIYRFYWDCQPQNNCRDVLHASPMLIVYRKSTKRFQVFEKTAAFIGAKLLEYYGSENGMTEIKQAIEEVYCLPEEVDLEADIRRVLYCLMMGVDSNDSKSKRLTVSSGELMTRSGRSISDDIDQITLKAHVPYFVTIELSSLCQLDCIHCYYPKGIKTLWNPKNFAALLDELKTAGVMELSFTGGECLLNDYAKLFLQMAADYGFVLHILTNAALITGDLAKFLATIQVHSVQISLYGSCSEIHDAITQRKGSFDQTLEGIRYLKKVGITPNLACVVMKQNLHDVSQLRLFCHELQIPISFNFDVFPSYNPDKKCASLNCLRDSRVSDFLSQDEFNPKLQKAKHELRQAVDVKDWVIQKKQTPPICTGGFNKIYIAADGDVMVCSVMRRKLGNIFEQSFSDIWRYSEALQDWRNLTLDHYEKCAECEASGVCSMCPGVNYITTKNLDKIDDNTCYRGKLNYRLIEALVKD